MKFSLAINMERMNPATDMRDVTRHTLEMVQMAETGGFDIAWSAEHHAMEMTIAPGPFQLLTWLGAHTSRIRLGTAVVVAAYWHPIRLAGEAALLDLLTGGRLEFGIGCGAYQREFDRMHPGLKAQESVPYMLEMLPLLKGLWQGDISHEGKFWSFPTSTSCPKPLQQPYPPLWAAVRSPASFDWAVASGCNVQTWALTRDFAEVETYMERFESALAKAPAGTPRPRFATMRHSAVYGTVEESEIYVKSLKRVAGQFESLFRGTGGVANGFPDEIDLASLEHRAEYDSDMLCRNLMFGTPDQVIAKLKRYEALGVDNFIYYASYGLPMDLQKKSLKLFIDEVKPAFAESSKKPGRAAAE
ncbi:MAG: flavin-dependent trigonelline monooxygenase, oxygenase component [Rhodospirillaceae bacterium]|nr:flavin-dependent trigonelline monooxygenase, oxygenase component [Rhodospirillaceae bacterium]